jgi:hypothetical protein
VFIDGQDAGIESDNSAVQVCQGHHTISIRSPQGTRNESVDLSGDKRLKIQL